MGASGYGAIVGGLFGTAGGVLQSLGEYKNSVESLTKNPSLQQGIDSSLADWKTSWTKGWDALRGSISKYFGDTKNAENRTGQEISSIDRFYNGGMQGSLGSLRANRYKALLDAADYGGNQAIRNVNLSRVGGEGGGSSYDRRMLMNNLTPIRVAAAADDANQARADFGYITDNQLALAGRRQALADTLAARGLQPENARRQMLGQNLQYLSAITAMDQANKFYGIKATPDDLMFHGNGIMHTIGTIGEGASVGASVGGMMGGTGGGGQPQQKKDANPQIQWGGGTPTYQQQYALNSGQGPLSQQSAYDNFNWYQPSSSYNATPASYGSWGGATGGSSMGSNSGFDWGIGQGFSPASNTVGNYGGGGGAWGGGSGFNSQSFQ